jgi:hypothetical protein
MRHWQKSIIIKGPLFERGDMTIKRLQRQREGAVIENDDTDDSLMLALYREAHKCFDELGVTGCDGCPVRTKCYRLWQTIENFGTYSLNLTKYRRFSQKFYMLKQERNAAIIYLGKRKNEGY